MASDVITAVILDDHPAIVAGVRAWCGLADPPIELIDAGDRIGRLWTEPGRSADVCLAGEEAPGLGRHAARRWIN